MAETIPQFDSLAQGLDYANTPTPTTDADPGSVSEFHEKDSTNDTPSLTVASTATEKQAAPGHGALLLTNFFPIDHQDRTKPHYDPD